MLHADLEAEIFSHDIATVVSHCRPPDDAFLLPLNAFVAVVSYSTCLAHLRGGRVCHTHTYTHTLIRSP